MGLFGDFKKSLAESAGRILWSQLQDTQQKMARLTEPVRTAALLGFLEKRDRLISNLDNMTSDGRIDLGKSLQSKARQTLDLNVAEGYALWLTGAWLESMNRPGIEAARVFEFLDQTATSAGGKLV
jgi:hypothetical protein